MMDGYALQRNLFANARREFRWRVPVTLKAGLETPIGGDWRVEPYLALQLNKPADELKRVLGLGLTFKVYFP